MSTLNVSNISDGTTTVGTSYVVNGSAKAWVIHNSSTVIKDSHNVSSITDTATGRTAVNFNSSFSTTTYAVSVCSMRGSTAAASQFEDNGVSKTASVCNSVYRSSSALADTNQGSVICMGALA